MNNPRQSVCEPSSTGKPFVITTDHQPISNSAAPNSPRSSLIGPSAAAAVTSATTTEATNELPPKKNTGLIRLLGAPMIDLVEAKKLAMEDEVEHTPVSEDPENVHSNADGEYVDASNEESFTLESFESLIRAARVNGKAFLLARVTTVDPNNLTRLYFSYYSAYHINRVIFRTQPEEGLLHRMKSRNPLNNMLIVGDVHYFVITLEEFDRAWEDRLMRKEQQRVLRSSSGQSDPELLKNVLRGSAIHHHRRSVSEMAHLGGGRISLINNTSSSSLPEVSAQERKTLPIDLSMLGDDDLTIPVIYEATFLGTDDDFLMRADLREFFKSNSVNPDDYQLFQLHRRSDLPYELTVLGPDGMPLSNGVNQMEARRRRLEWRTAYGLLDDGEHKSMICGLRLGYLSPIGFWLSMLLMSAITVFAALIFIPSPYQYFAYAGIVVVFAVVLLVFVSWGDNRSE